MKSASILSTLLIACQACHFVTATSSCFVYSPPSFAKILMPFSSQPHGDSYRRCQLRRWRHHGISGSMIRKLAKYSKDGLCVDDSPSGDATSESKQAEYIWDIYVSQPTTKNKEKGAIPTSSLIEAFIWLAPASGILRAHQFRTQNKLKGKGHLVRCIQRKRNAAGSDGGGVDVDGDIVSALEIKNVDSVDKVYRILQEHMKLVEINPKACECMQYYFDGNQSLEEGNPSQAITLYNLALSTATSQPVSQLPKGSILMKRARAYLKRATNHRKILRALVKDLAEIVPSASTMKILYQTASTHPALSPSIFDRLIGDSKVQQASFRSIRYRHDMYEFALLHAVKDSLEATQISPENAQAWLLAGECLAELRKLKESNQYYRRALEIDPSMGSTMEGVMEKNRVSQKFMDAARVSGFSGDTLRLALDVAA